MHDMHECIHGGDGVHVEYMHGMSIACMHGMWSTSPSYTDDISSASIYYIVEEMEYICIL